MRIDDFTILKRIVRPTKMYNLYHFRSITGFTLDSRTLKKGQAFVALKGTNYDGHDFIRHAVRRGASAIVAQHDIADRPKVPFFLVEDSYQALGEIASYIRRKKKPFIYGITGSVGKTTTKEMLHFLLKDNYSILKNHKTDNNILGVAKTIFALGDEKIMILELGTNQLGEICTLAKIARPDVGIITSIKPVHLEGLKDLRGVFKEKTCLLKVNPRIKAVLNRGDSYLKKIRSGKKILWFGKDKQCDLYGRLIRRDLKNVTFLIQDKFELIFPRQFEWFIDNALAALLGASLYGLSIESLV
ncbi:MAG: hypothetical protein JSW40_05845, partial [Candidatus Omnitrophota bacterium]